MERNKNNNCIMDPLNKVISFVSLDGKIFRDPMLIDSTLIDRLNEMLESYIGPNEDYIKLVYSNRIINTTNIFKIDNDFIISDDIQVIQVIRDYKKYVYLHVNNNVYDDDYYKLISNLREIISIDYIINTEYYELILHAVGHRRYCDILKYVSHDIKNNYDIVLMAVTNYVRSLEHVSEDMKNNKNIVLAAVNIGGAALEYASEAMKNDRDIVLAAVNDYCFALKYASEDMKNDRDIVLLAVNNAGSALQYASEAMKNDRDIVLAAISNDCESLEFASYAIKNDRDIILATIANSNIYTR